MTECYFSLIYSVTCTKCSHCNVCGIFLWLHENELYFKKYVRIDKSQAQS